MDDSLQCRNFSRSTLSQLREFLLAHPHLLQRIPQARHSEFIKLCGYVAHLRSRKAVEFFMIVFRSIEALADRPDIGAILRGAIFMGSRGWALVEPYLSAVSSLPMGARFLTPFTLCAESIARRDADCAIAFLRNAPIVVQSTGEDGLLKWGERARDALRAGRHVWKAARAYLEEAAANRCGTSPERWVFNLEQAGTIAMRSSEAAEEFIRLGARLCLLLNEEDTKRWVQTGLAECRTTEELCSYFSCVSLKALETRDGLVSGVALKDRVNSLTLLCEAYLGQPVKIRSNRSLIGVKAFTGGPATDGRTVFLPESVQGYTLLKLMALHQTALLQAHDLAEVLKDGAINETSIHMEADRRLLQRLPNLLGDMKRLAESLPELFPDCDSGILRENQLWWGNLLPEFVADTSKAVAQVKQELCDEAQLPPEIVEALLESLLAEGARDADTLLARLGKMLEFVDFESPDVEDLGEEVQTFLYKEWDQDLADYKLDWCLVRQRPVPDDPNPFAQELRDRLQSLVRLIRRQFSMLKPERFKKYRAQPFGDDLDLDALVRAVIDMRCGSFLSDDVYIRRDKRLRDVAVLFLVDLSGSTEEQVHGRRVVDIQKEAITLMAEALDSLGDPFAVYGFSSEGRFRVDLLTVKSFREQYGDKVRHRIGNLEPANLTRLGAVIRHATSRLDEMTAAVKLMVILTDGRPYDIEYGSLDYAMADTRKAFKEARLNKVHPFIITSDEKGASYLKKICPQTQSVVLPKAEVLPHVLPAIYRRLTA
ncbi:MAG: VWA domain-containing protein [Desulfomonile tiedjei]|uniref:VWA domain-containing protein n=1 Tax=Desulfomonile tiedjei TaxID=2358 RepID=A0A9D6Z4M9_9BACT|nr:VWA domain-containing protein [Desulfomonile tiedjei]